MSYTAHIKDLTTGEVRTHSFDEWGEGEDAEVSEFLWSDGNYACDCNRALFFYNFADPWASERKCGDERFVVRITDDSGKELYCDDRWLSGEMSAERTEMLAEIAADAPDRSLSAKAILLYENNDPTPPKAYQRIDKIGKF